jgi:hypothetical protein
MVVGETLMTLQMPVLSWSASQTMMDKKVFGVIEDVKNMGLPSNEKVIYFTSTTTNFLS